MIRLWRNVHNVAYGGNYYAIVDPQKNWAGPDGMTFRELIAHSRNLRIAIVPVVYPTHPEDDRDPQAHGFQIA